MSSKVMKIFVKWKLVIPMFLFLTVFLLLFHQFYQSNLDCKVVEGLHEYCNNPLLHEHGTEGDVPFSDFRLVSLHTLMRHGDRSPIHILNTKNIPTKSFRCSFDTTMKKQMPIISHFEETMEESKHLFKSDNLIQYAHFSLYPNSTICASGMLTPQGSSQLIRNGIFLQVKYRRHGLFEQPNYEKNFKVVTTQFSRTFQTAVSFMYGFLPKFDLTKLKFETAARATMCREGYGLKCACPAVEGMENTFSCTFEQHWPKSWYGKSDLYDQVLEKFKFEPERPNPHPSHVYDFLVTHQCHNQTINTCLLNQVFTHVQSHGIKAGKNKRYIDQARLKMLPLIVEISRRMINLSKQPLSSDPKRAGPAFVLYSGHDSTIEPFSKALGVGQGHWPKYSSRVVLEHYKEITTDKNYLRILIDGVAVTHIAPFCDEKDDLLKAHRLCLLKKFLDFVDDLVKDYRTDCLRGGTGPKNGERMAKELTEAIH